MNISMTLVRVLLANVEKKITTEYTQYKNELIANNFCYRWSFNE